jgi:uncharacterized protein (TIGR03545 family)
VRTADLLRLRALAPLAVAGALLTVAWWWLLDPTVARRVENAGTYFMGAKVEVASADVRLTDGSVRLRGLTIANPDQPMTNLLDAEEVVADFRLFPLLERKIHLDTIALRGVRFGTERETSGALDHPREGSGLLWREVSAWAEAIHIPSFSLEGLGQVVNVAAIVPDSLRTLTLARQVAAAADSASAEWRARLTALDPRPRMDSARTLIRRLNAVTPLTQGVKGLAELAADGRSTVRALDSLRDGLAALSSGAAADARRLSGLVAELEQARGRDYAYARGLLKLPSLDAPDISPAIFGKAAVGWARPLLYWLNLAERYLPPGLQPRRLAGERRARRAGTTVQFSRAGESPRFVLAYGEAAFSLAGTGAAAGDYVARITGLTTAPSLYGRPLMVEAERAEPGRGPSRVRAFAVLDHVMTPVRDSVDVVVDGIPLPRLELAPLGARLHLGNGLTTVALTRVGDQLDARWAWRTTSAVWTRLEDSAAAGSPAPTSALVGSRAWAKDLLWRSVSTLTDVTIEVGLSGAFERPSLAVRSNVGDVIARSLRDEVGREIARQEAEVRRQVDALVERGAAEARGKVESARALVDREITGRRAEVDSLRVELESEVRRLTRGGIRVPGGSDGSGGRGGR